MFTKHTMKTHEWSSKYENITVPCESMNIGYTAVIAAISEGCGFEYIELHDRGINGPLFISFLFELEKLNKGRKVTLFMDNLTAHKTPEARAAMDLLKFEYIYNVPYSPQFNSIEMPFAPVKKNFKELKLQGLVNEDHFD